MSKRSQDQVNRTLVAFFDFIYLKQRSIVRELNSFCFLLKGGWLWETILFTGCLKKKRYEIQQAVLHHKRS